MDIRQTQPHDWPALKRIRLAALLDAPTAFGMTYQSAAGYTDEQWQARAAGTNGTQFWLAWQDENPVGMVGAALNQNQRYNLIGMWLDPAARGRGVAARLVETVKTGARLKGHGQVYLDVAPDNTSAVNLYQQQGFSFIDEWEPLESHPHIQVQTMCCALGH